MGFKPRLDCLLEFFSPSVLCGAGGVATITVVGGLHWFLSKFFYDVRRKSRQRDQNVMKGVVITSYNGIQSIEVRNDLPIPKILDSDEVLIKVIAAGLDPIDLKISWGYGKTIRSHLRRYNKHVEDEFPIVLGRQCSGIVLNCGRDVLSVSKGDAVWVISAYCLEGLIVEYAVVKEDQVALKPENVTFEEAASLPYTAMQMWNVLINQAKLGPKLTKGKRVLVHAGNSPTGLLAIQWLKAWGAHVTTAVPTIGLPMCHVLNADDIIVYSVTDFEAEFRRRKKFDIVVNTIGTIAHQISVDISKPGGKVVTLVATPTVMDKFGFFAGSLSALAFQIAAWIRKIKHGATSQFWWSSFSYDKEALEVISTLVKEGKIHPIIETVYEMYQADDAFQ